MTKIGLDTFEFRKMPERGVTREQWLAFYDVLEDAAQQGWHRRIVEDLERRAADPPFLGRYSEFLADSDGTFL